MISFKLILYVLSEFKFIEDYRTPVRGIELLQSNTINYNFSIVFFSVVAQLLY